ncbi:hypothetical protein FACS1894156_0810 [Bacteroidia bacterium]|nr:hypothetical protein AGMMS4956_04270 [Bacteroidia bacterium]GHU93665.1 hypothetical protein FACS1894156_0810 [Bacteroidia bacterium]
MRSLLTYTISLLVVVLLLCGCHREYISKQKLVNILAEMHFVDALYAEQSVEKKRLSSQQDSMAFYGPIFEKYDASFLQLQPSMARYANNKENATKLYEKVVQILEKKEQLYALELEKYKEQQRKKVGKFSL